MKKNKPELIIFLDCGDTLVDESTQTWDGTVVKTAKLFPGAKEAVLTLYEEGYTIVLVADGLTESFENIFRQHGIGHIFTHKVISEEIGCEKPNPLMFITALQKLGLEENEISNVVMIGNNIKRDILGANRRGIASVLLTLSPRYDMEPSNIEETPDYTVDTPEKFPELMRKLEQLIQEKQPLKQNSN